MSLLLFHAFLCFAMTGIIWLVQLLIYPQFKIIGQNEFSKAHQFHTERISWVVAPLMVLELLTAAMLCFQSESVLLYLNLILVGSLWLLTFLVNVPAHHRLTFDIQKSKNDLVRLNWPRTFLWSLRSLILFYLIPFSLSGGL